MKLLSIRRIFQSPPWRRGMSPRFTERWETFIKFETAWI